MQVGVLLNVTRDYGKRYFSFEFVLAVFYTMYFFSFYAQIIVAKTKYIFVRFFEIKTRIN